MARVRHEVPNERNIVTYYFTDSTRNKLVKNTTRWYRYPRAAAKAAMDNLMVGMFPEATVCVVYDDYFGEDHAIFVRRLNGRVEAVPLRNVAEPVVAGTTRDPKGSFVKKIAKSREKYAAMNTPEVLMALLGIKKVDQ